jgi:scyllo-inositol 2-dehydrogenase (NADP+)
MNRDQGLFRVGLAGFGLGGRAFHAPFITTTPGLRLTHVFQRRGNEAAEIYPDVRVVRDFDALLPPDEGIDLVVIATPNETHAPLAARALEAGKHVVVDKPFAITSGDCERLTAVARQRGLTLSVYHNRRWDGDFLTVVTIIRRGWLGRLERFESRFDRYRPEVQLENWRNQALPGSGLTYDLAPHLLDQAFLLFGRPAALDARIAAERPTSVTDDSFEITLHYGPFEARLGASMMAERPAPRFRIQGALGVYERHGVDPQEARLRAGARPNEPGWGEDAADRWGAIRATIDGLAIAGTVRTLPGHYGSFYQNIRDAIHGRAPLSVTPEEATETIRALELAFESSRRGGCRLDY